MKSAIRIQESPQSLSLAEAILSSINTPMLAIDGGNRVLAANPAAEEFLQASQHVLADMTIDDIFGGDVSGDDILGGGASPVVSLLVRARQSAGSVNHQGVEICTPRLGRKVLNIQISPLLDHPRGLVVAIQEHALAERLRGQEKFRGAVRSMEHIVALLAHEIKNPLAGIRGAAELIATDPQGDSQSLTDLITAEADRIAALLTRAETLGGGQPPQRQPVNINEILHHAITLAESSFGKGCVIERQFDPSLPMASGDRDLLVQCFINLIKNACEALDKNGKISIKTSFNLEARFAIGPRGMEAGRGYSNGLGNGLGNGRGIDQNKAPLLVEISDNGAGIPDNIRPHVFDPFVTSKATGSGLGLAMVASTVASHDGTIDLESTPGRTEFRISLPMAEVSLPMAETEAAS